MSNIRSFNEILSFNYSEQLKQGIKNDIESRSKAYILTIDEATYKAYLVDQFTLEPLVIDYDSEFVGEPTSSHETRDDTFRTGNKYEVDVYTFTVRYNFTGSVVLFRIRSGTWQMVYEDIYVNEQSNSVSFSFKLYKKDAEEYNRTKNSYRGRAFANIGGANAFAHEWNSGLKGWVDVLFQNQKNKFQKENDFFSAINIKVNSNTSSVFTPPTIKKKIIPQPKIDDHTEFASEPTMGKEMYWDVLKVIYDSGKNMEKKPSLYLNKDEGGLRDQFLFMLETRYVGTTASGETFNRSGKTDIILKYADDGSNLFVAECKIWHGASEFLEAISQLFDRYLTWRDSKVALILFVKNKDFTNVLTTIKSDIKKHPYFVREKGGIGETSFSYIFHLQQDKNKAVFFEVMAFHYDK